MAAQQLIIFPFQVVSAQDQAVIERGVNTVLRQRLAGEGVELITANDRLTPWLVDDNSVINQGNAALAVDKLGADFALFGSIVSLGKSFTLDAKLYDGRSNKTTLTYSRLGSSNDEIIPLITKLTDQVRALMNPKAQQGSTDVSPVIALTAPAQIDGKNTWKSPRFDGAITGMAIGDVNGDGAKNLVFCQGRQLQIFKINDKELEQIAVLKNGNGEEMIGVDIADIDQDGLAEIFISNIENDKRSLKSFVVQWDGKEFARKAELPYLLRVISNKDAKPFLLGQRHQRLDVLFGDQVYRFAYSNGQYRPETKTTYPAWLNISGLAIRPTEKGLETVALNNKGNINILDHTGEVSWHSQEIYGGSTSYLTYRDASVSNRNQDPEKLFYLQTRLVYCNIDDDPAMEIVTIKNEELSGNLLMRLRSYKTGKLAVIDQNNLGYYEKSSSQPMANRISDFGLADLNGDSRLQMIYAVVDKSDGWFSKDKSYIVVQDIDTLQ